MDLPSRVEYLGEADFAGVALCDGVGGQIAEGLSGSWWRSRRSTPRGRQPPSSRLRSMSAHGCGSRSRPRR